MFRRFPQRPTSRRRSPAAVAALACTLLGLGTAPAAAAGVLSSFTLMPASTQAGASTDVTADLTFSYGADTRDSVRSVTIDLPPGLLASIANVPATCSQDELSRDACPVGSQIGTGTVTTRDGGGDRPRDTGLYLMPPPTSSDAAAFGTVVVVSGTSYTGVGTLDVVPGAGGQPVGEVKLSVPVVSGEQVVELRATMSGTLAGGQPFAHLPTSCAAAGSTASVETSEGNPGDGADSFFPTGCSALGYAPMLTAVQAVKDPGDSGVELIVTLTQPNAMTESATRALTLHWPSSLLPNADPDGACLLGTPCTIGTATATSPLAPLSYLSSGTLTLGGTPQAPTLTVGFPPPVPLSIVGAIDLAAGTVTFPAVPDIPLSALTVHVTGPAGAEALGTTCEPGSLLATFTPQSGGATVMSTQPVAYQGCPGPKPPLPKPLSVAIGGTRALVVHGRAGVKLTCGGGRAGSVCRGRLSLTRRVRIVHRPHGRRTVVRRTIVLARAGYTVASGRTRTVTVTSTAAGLRLLAHAHGHRLRARATATLHGGHAAHRTLLVRLASTSTASR